MRKHRRATSGIYSENCLEKFHWHQAGRVRQCGTMKRLALFLALAIPLFAEPADMVRLREDWQRARERAITPLDQKYLTALKALKERLVREKKLEDAVVVEREMNRVAGAEGGWFKSKVTPEILAIGEWRFDTKEPKPYATHITLKKNGEVIERGNKEPLGKWEIKDGKVLRLDLKWSWAEFDLEYEGSTPSLTETKFDGGTRKGTTLTQIVDP
jgi:hypothetical protein